MDWGLLERDPSFGYGNGSKWPYSLRSQRIYRQQWVYYIIFAINFCLRFVGMITLMPPVYLSRSTGLIVNTYNDPDFQLFAASIVASAEIFRRTIWALLRVEWEVIKTSSEQKNKEVCLLENGSGNLLEEEGMKPMAISSSSVAERGWRVWPFPGNETFSIASLSDMSHLNDIQVLSELCVWATIFSGIPLILAAHRETL